MFSSFHLLISKDCGECWITSQKEVDPWKATRYGINQWKSGHCTERQRQRRQQLQQKQQRDRLIDPRPHATLISWQCRMVKLVPKLLLSLVAGKRSTRSKKPKAKKCSQIRKVKKKHDQADKIISSDDKKSKKTSPSCHSANQKSSLSRKYQLSHTKQLVFACLASIVLLSQRNLFLAHSEETTPEHSEPSTRADTLSDTEYYQNVLNHTFSDSKYWCSDAHCTNN